MTRFILFQINILFLFLHQSVGQPIQNHDSLIAVNDTIIDSAEKVDNLARLYNAYLYNDPEKALKFAKDEIQVAQRINYAEGIGIGLYHIGVYFNNINKADSAKHYYLLAKDQFKAINQMNRIIAVNHGLAIIEYSQGNYDKAIELLNSNISINLEKEYDSLITEKRLNLAIAYDLMGQIQLFKGNHNIALEETMKAMNLLESLDKPIRKADALNHLGSIELYLNNYHESIKYNKEALVIYREYNDKYYEAQVLNDIGNCYYYLQVYDSSRQYLEDAILLTREIGANDIEGTALNNLGKVYLKLGYYAKSIDYSDKALIIHEKTGSQNKIVESLCDLGQAYNEMGQYNTAIHYFDRAIELATRIGVKENIRIGYFNRSKSYEKLADFQRSLDDYKAYKKTEDSIFSEAKSRQIEEMRAIYETDRKEQEIAMQKNEIQLLEEQDKVKTLQLTSQTIGIVVLIVVLGLVYYAMHQKVRRKQLQKEVVDQELEFKRKELTTHALHLANKNEILEQLKMQIDDMKKGVNDSGAFRKISNAIKFNLQDDKNWENFSKYFEEVHKDFNVQIKKKYPEVTSNELRFMALLKMNLSSKEIANILNISSDGIKKARYRLRKKLNINSDESLNDLIITF
jgi:tetratricopeptide (TPR) repeat protein